ncbi:gas vesicle protein [Pedobacter sp. CG_S7]|uniref:YtxH domain-containing protein n=1 Tax=Pedobacter sp. CG_S7 TaxID=3143930 RepID=UPI003390ED66
MKFKKLISDCAASKSDSSLPIVALIAGLAVGAVIGILFAPESGADTRGKIADKADDLTESVKEKVQSMKAKCSTEAEKALEAKDRIVEDVRRKSKNVSDSLQGLKDEATTTPGAPQNI